MVVRTQLLQVFLRLLDYRQLRVHSAALLAIFLGLIWETSRRLGYGQFVFFLLQLWPSGVSVRCCGIVLSGVVHDVSELARRRVQAEQGGASFELSATCTLNFFAEDWAALLVYFGWLSDNVELG